MAWYDKLAIVVGMVLFMECFAWDAQICHARLGLGLASVAP
jgi:hypothetical protein